MVRNTELMKKQKLSNVKAIAANGKTVLHLVVEDGNFTAQERIEILKKLVANGLDPNSKNQQDETVLHLAIKTRARDVIDFLLKRKVALDNSAAIYLIEIEHCKLLKLKNRSDDEMQKQESESASFLEWMITRGLDVDSQNLYGRSALFLAIDYDLLHLLPVLMKYTNQINYVGYETSRTLLYIVVGNKAQTRWSPSYSRRYGTSIVKILLDRGVSPEFIDESLNTALHLAIEKYDDTDVIQMLIDNSTNFNHKNDAGETPFLIAIRGWLKWAKPSIDECRKILESLIMKGAVVDEGNKSEFRSLHIFAKETSSRKCLKEEEIELFKMLISVGCNVNAKDLNGRTPLHLAAAGKNKAVVQKLIGNGASINPRDDDGATPLHLAVCNEAAAKIVKILIEHGANVNAEDGKGFTPLHKAAGDQESRADATARLSLLLEQGADFCALSDEGYHVLAMSAWRIRNCFLYVPDDSDYESESLDKISNSDIFGDESLYMDDEYRFLFEHWIKLHAAKLNCSVSDNIDANTIMEDFDELECHHDDCIEEIKILKGTFIDNNRTSFYDFLHMNLNSRRAHIHNVKLQQLVQSPAQLKKRFPHYAILILSSYNKTIRRKSLMESVKKAWIKMTKINLGDLCIEHIFSFLSNAELYDLIEASEIDYYR